jgi:hypothetical protein
MLRHSCADVIAGAEVQQNGADATRRRGGAAAGQTARWWRDQPSRFATPDCSRELHVEVIVVNLTSREIQSYLKALEACRLQCCKWRRGTQTVRVTVHHEHLSNITDTTPIAVQRSTRNFARGVFRVINNFVAAIIAERERQANLAILRNLSDIASYGIWALLGARSVLVWLRRPRSEHCFRSRWRSVVPSSGKVSGCCLNLS